MTLTHEDLAHAAAVWNERVGDAYDLDVQIVGEHQPATMDPDRPLGAILTAKLSLRLRILGPDGVIFDQSCPYDRDALLRSVRALSAHLLERD